MTASLTRVLENYVFRGFYIPEHMVKGLHDYIERGQKPGDFLCCVLANDLMEACGRADDHNLRNLPAYCAFLYNYAPPECYGSEEKVNAWIERGGMIGERDL